MNRKAGAEVAHALGAREKRKSALLLRSADRLIRLSFRFIHNTVGIIAEERQEQRRICLGGIRIANLQNLGSSRRFLENR